VLCQLALSAEYAPVTALPSELTTRTVRSVPWAAVTVIGVVGLTFSLAVGVAVTLTGSATTVLLGAPLDAAGWLAPLEAGSEPADTGGGSELPELPELDVQAVSRSARPTIGTAMRRSAELGASCENN
jgi:hypothetical protein